VADGRDRTEAEREAARREREAARRGRAGVFEQEEADGPAPDPEPPSAEPLAQWDEPGAEDHPQEGYEQDHVGFHDGDDAELGAAAGGERPSGTRRISHLERRGRRPHTPRPVRRRPVQGGRRHSWRGRLGALIAVILAGALIWFGVELFQPFGTSPHGSVTVVIPPHASAKQIGNLLQSDGVIAHGFFFEVRATLSGERGALRSGTYHLQQDMSYSAALAALTKVPKAAPTSQLTIAEGHSRQYVSTLLRRQGIRGSYLVASRHSPLLDPHTYGAPRHVASLEGFLFPDTFTLVQPVKVSKLVADQLKDFKRRFAGVNLAYARSKHLNAYDVLKIASLIEGEAATRHDLPLVASVIYNRLADHMMLQLDSTTRYATGNFTRPLTESELRDPSPYNTRVHTGLPPTPINSPGLAAIQAAAHPATSKYLYFFTGKCGNQNVFASNYTTFLNQQSADKRRHC
jgi:UPF0755 protein